MSDFQRIFKELLTALETETQRRDQRPLEEWILAERYLMFREVNRLREKRGAAPIQLTDIERAERTAVGHVDYVRKYALAATDLVLQEKR